MNQLTIASHQDVLALGWTGERLLTRLIDLDTKHIDGLDETDEGSVSQWAPVFMQHPDTWALLVDRSLPTSVESVVGYWSFCSLQPEPYSRVLAGQFHDSELTPAAQCSIDGPGEYDIYIVMFVITLPHRRAGSAMLVRFFFENLERLARRGVFVRRMSANAYTPAGVRLCPIFGLEPHCPHEKRGHIWARTIPHTLEKPFPGSFPELNRLYAARRPASAPCELSCAA